ncbi:MAG: hypothetical protein GXP55_05935, partial [Deltaproteobacteria bacterium]|nr:hypothetical protein [Deltaproteobacteria bacterium]
MSARLAIGCVAVALLGLTLTTPARGALPPAFGGSLVLPAQATPSWPDPRELTTPLEASVADAVFDTLYASDARGRITPMLAAGPPVREGERVRIPLREQVRRHDGEFLSARDVISSLNRALASPHSAWLLAAFARRDAGLDVDAPDEHTLSFRLRVANADVAHILASRPLAIRVGRRGRLGTGPYRARLGRDELSLHAFAGALRGAPYLRTLRLRAPVERTLESRELALGGLDASWVGSGVYGHARALRRTPLGRSSPILLVRNRATGPLARDATWGKLARLVQRRRLRRLGLEATQSVSYALPPPSLPAGSGDLPRRLSFLARAGHPLEAALAQALAAMFDDAGVLVEVRTADAEAYARAMARGRYDLRIETITPPLLSPSAILGAAFAATGQAGRAHALAR